LEKVDPNLWWGFTGALPPCGAKRGFTGALPPCGGKWGYGGFAPVASKILLPFSKRDFLKVIF